MAVGPWARLATIITTNAPIEKAANTFSGGICAHHERAEEAADHHSAPHEIR